ncbi:hypothetical protein E2562_024974 [Oryza meyeriana var. granulata]|uniref:Uncharacterized protein n=1 Tax=Oryza meyeriana var. granulata TaxID=110450 RepID=A0A6G1DN37_9ORYZ|nr:hypothetical protein E2562_024974 [Oryza meyeriana var. granulata]
MLADPLLHLDRQVANEVLEAEHLKVVDEVKEDRRFGSILCVVGTMQTVTLGSEEVCGICMEDFSKGGARLTS